jgi:hypothetical protein
MHPIIHQELMNARAADFHRRAGRDRIARAAIQASRLAHHGRHPAVGRPARVFGRGLRIMLGARSA